MLVLLALAVVIAFVLSIGAALLISTHRVASIGARPSAQSVLARK